MPAPEEDTPRYRLGPRSTRGLIAGWRTGQIAFHQSSVDRSLRRHWPTLGLSAGNRVFAPLCGKSLDLLWLRDQGLEVLGVELAAAA